VVSSGCKSKPLYELYCFPMRATCLVYLIVRSLITLIMIGVSWRFSLRGFLHAADGEVSVLSGFCTKCLCCLVFVLNVCLSRFRTKCLPVIGRVNVARTQWRKWLSRTCSWPTRRREGIFILFATNYSAFPVYCSAPGAVGACSRPIPEWAWLPACPHTHICVVSSP
jgi:hypothetical protein